MARHILSGQVIVNGTDIWTVYNAFLREEQKGGHENLNALLAPAKTKGNVAVNIREQNGEEYSADLRPRSEGRDVTLHFAISTTSTAEFVQRYIAFVKFLKSGEKGWLTFKFPTLDLEMRMFADQFPNGFTAISNLWSDGQQCGAFKVKFREPVASF